ncbi:MAG: hypothetical protein QXI58_00745 [Candidatus Micrarchaeia archaeon]
MTNAQIISFLAAWIVIIVQFLRERGFYFNWRIASIVCGAILGFLWWLFSIVPAFNWIPQLFGAQLVNELWITMILKGMIAGFGATYTYAVVETLFKKIGR